jgi:hypothetical protein
VGSRWQGRATGSAGRAGPPPPPRWAGPAPRQGRAAGGQHQAQHHQVGGAGQQVGRAGQGTPYPPHPQIHRSHDSISSLHQCQ